MADSFRRRTSIKFISVNREQNFVRILVPEWNDTQSIRLYWSKLPSEIKNASKAGMMCSAKVNIDPANKAAELLFEDWRLE